MDHGDHSGLAGPRWRLHATRIHVHARAHLTLDVAREVAIALGAFFVYFGVRGLTEGDVDRAVDNAGYVIDLERWLGILIEDDIQRLIDGSALLIKVMNWTYIWGHWPVIAVVAAWLIVYRPREYRRLRNAFLISGGIGLVIFAAFPLAPPRLLDLGLIDTVTDRSYAYRVLQPKAFVNQYAAMPSLHFGWNLLIGIELAARLPGPAKLAGVLLPVLMAFAVVATANHFVLDAVAGGALALLGLWAATLLEKRLQPRTPRPA